MFVYIVTYIFFTSFSCPGDGDNAYTKGVEQGVADTQAECNVAAEVQEKEISTLKESLVKKSDEVETKAAAIESKEAVIEVKDAALKDKSSELATATAALSSCMDASAICADSRPCMYLVTLLLLFVCSLVCTNMITFTTKYYLNNYIPSEYIYSGVTSVYTKKIR